MAKDPDRAAWWWGWVAEHNLSALGRSIHRLIREGKLDPKAAGKLLGYFERGASALRSGAGTLAGATGSLPLDPAATLTTIGTASA